MSALSFTKPNFSSTLNLWLNDDFIRIYIGISRPAEDKEIISHVLGRPEGSDFLEFKEGIERGASAAVSLLTTTAVRVMNEYNRRSNQDKSN